MLGGTKRLQDMEKERQWCQSRQRFGSNGDTNSPVEKTALEGSLGPYSETAGSKPDKHYPEQHQSTFTEALPSGRSRLRRLADKAVLRSMYAVSPIMEMVQRVVHVASGATSSCKCR